MTDKWVTSRTLLERAKDPDDEEAWEEFVAYYESFIRNVLGKISFRTDQFDDLTQVILVAILKSLGSFQPDEERGTFRGWLALLIRHKLMDHIRKECSYKERIDKAGDPFG